MRCATAALAALIAVGFAAPGDAAEIDSARSVIPERAWLDLDLDPQATGYTGRISFDLRILQSVASIPLRSQDLRIDSAELLTEAGRTLLLRVDDTSPAGLLQLIAPQALLPGAARLEVRFAGEFREDGIAREVDAEGRPRLLRHAEQASGRAFPVIDGGDARHVWELSLALPAALQASAMSEQVGIEKVRDGWRRLRFAPTSPIAASELRFSVQAQPTP